MRDRRRHFREALGFAWDGFRYVWRTQGNMRIHAGFGVMVIALARWLGFDAVRLAVVMLTVGAVIGAEWLNTAIERAVDLVTTRPHPLARLAKDLAAGAVLWFGLVAVVVGVLLFGPYLPDLPALIARSSPGRLAEVGAMLAVGLALVFTGIRR
ncbi:MAG: diacylglycerol kinase family protein [Thermaerobacter sp.]|mgnify:CR=1 FL=1